MWGVQDTRHVTHSPAGPENARAQPSGTRKLWHLESSDLWVPLIRRTQSHRCEKLTYHLPVPYGLGRKQVISSSSLAISTCRHRTGDSSSWSITEEPCVYCPIGGRSGQGLGYVAGRSWQVGISACWWWEDISGTMKAGASTEHGFAHRKSFPGHGTWIWQRFPYKSS